MIEYELKKAESLEEGCKNLYEIIKLLRSPEGCPWDRVQTNKSATESMIDEAYEYLDGAIRNDVSSMREEIGDVLINAFMNLYINEEHGDFKAEDALNEVCEKLIRRHPHVFSNMHAETEAEGLSLWNSIKENVEGQKEKSEDFFSHIPASIPPLEEAYEIQKMREAYYYFIHFESDATVPGEIEQRVRIMDNVLRYLCVKQEA